MRDRVAPATLVLVLVIVAVVLLVVVPLLVVVAVLVLVANVVLVVVDIVVPYCRPRCRRYWLSLLSSSLSSLLPFPIVVPRCRRYCLSYYRPRCRRYCRSLLSSLVVVFFPELGPEPTSRTMSQKEKEKKEKPGPKLRSDTHNPPASCVQPAWTIQPTWQRFSVHSVDTISMWPQHFHMPCVPAQISFWVIEPLDQTHKKMSSTKSNRKLTHIEERGGVGGSGPMWLLSFSY